MSCVMPCGVTCLGYVVTFALVFLSCVFCSTSRLVSCLFLFTTKKRGLTFTSARVLVRAQSGKVKKYRQFGTWSKSFSQSRNFPARLGGAEESSLQDCFWAPRSVGDEACSTARVKHYVARFGFRQSNDIPHAPHHQPLILRCSCVPRGLQ